MIHAGRRVVHGVRSGGLTTHAERDEWARATPEIRAFAMVRLPDEQHQSRARIEGSHAPRFSLDEIADAGETHGRQR